MMQLTFKQATVAASAVVAIGLVYFPRPAPQPTDQCPEGTAAFESPGHTFDVGWLGVTYTDRYYCDRFIDWSDPDDVKRFEDQLRQAIEEHQENQPVLPLSVLAVADRAYVV